MKNKNYSKLNLDLSFIKYIKVHTVELKGWVGWNMMSRLSLLLVGCVEWVGSVG